MKKIYLAVAIILIVTVFGCQHSNLSKSSVGTGVGAVLGGIGGKILGDGKNEVALIGAVASGWIGNRIGQYLDDQDKQKLSQSSQEAITTGETQTWKNPETKNSGQVAVVDERKEETDIKVRVLKDRVEKVPPLEMVGQRYILTSDSNLRGGPSKDYKVLTVLESGTVVDTIGKVQDKPWMMIGQNQVGNGFIHTSLIEEAPTDAEPSEELVQQGESQGEIAEESVSVSRTCRTVRQTVTLEDGTTQEEEITACQGPNGWETI